MNTEDDEFERIEREECAKLCESADKSTHPCDLAKVIRARGCDD